MTATARVAASLAVVRRRRGRCEALTGVRGAGARFMAMRRVFPGGALEAADRAAAAEWRDHALDPGCARAGGPDALALALCALREAREETGLNVAMRPDRLRLFARAITPLRAPKRFDAWFFVARAEDLLVEATPNAAPDGELHAIGWTPLGPPTEDAPFPTALLFEELGAALDAADWAELGRAPWRWPRMFLDQRTDCSVVTTL